jgi:undecaprenyl-diphosphatase
VGEARKRSKPPSKPVSGTLARPTVDLAGGHLPLHHAVVLGAIQGPTELLPVSSSGHLVLAPRLFDWPYTQLDPELRKSFEVALHAGTAAALLIGLRKEVGEYLRGFGVLNVVSLVASFAPAAVIAYVFERQIEERLSEPGPVAVALLVGAVGMAVADGRPEERSRDDARVADALVIGMAQACALAPGVSRNGATLAAARWRRFRRRDSNVISRQIALPVIVGAAVLKGVRLAKRGGIPAEVARGMAAGAGAAFASTLVSMRLIGMLERGGSLRPYAVYRAGLAITVLARRRRRGNRHAAQQQSQAPQPPLRQPTAVE